MDIKELPNECPRCKHTIFKQKIAIEGFADKIYSMIDSKEHMDHPVMVDENELSENDYYNDIVCNACGETIVKAGVNK